MPSPGFPVDLPAEPHYRKRGEPAPPGIILAPIPVPKPTPVKLQIPLPSSVSDPPHSNVEKMMTGQYFNPREQAYVNGIAFAQDRLHKLNSLSPGENGKRNELFTELFGTFTANHPEGATIRTPFHCELGGNIHMGKKIFINFNCTILDIAPVIIGDGVLIGPNVCIIAASDPVDPENRNQFSWYGLPVVLSPGCWIAAGAIILPGVTVGEYAVVGAGSVVTKDVEPYAVVAGNPARKLRDVRDKRERPEKPTVDL